MISKVHSIHLIVPLQQYLTILDSNTFFRVIVRKNYCGILFMVLECFDFVKMGAFSFAMVLLILSLTFIAFAAEECLNK